MMMISDGRRGYMQTVIHIRMWLRPGWFVLLLIAVLAAAQDQKSKTASTYTTPLATGVRLDAEGEFIDLGSMPLGMALASSRKQVVAVLGGWREQGIQVVDLNSRKVT